MRKTGFVTASTTLLFVPIWRCFSSYNASHIQYPPVSHTVGTSASRCVGSESNTQYRSPTAFCYCLLSWILNPCLGPVSRKRCPRYEYDDSTHPCQTNMIRPNHYPFKASVRVPRRDPYRHFAEGLHLIVYRKDFDFIKLPGGAGELQPET
ncbi:uncharacterized protein BKA55DRAFT_72040 [Fusarium redolens]|uniref:Uncharacterized protein n=1 Tax=Fusarium redolens TaxID=48865 RepID=A0A9P9GZI1_FUSRE|nr:uncharacterized protein BKA55DRAFT_72040 [Fusarium redolens]KAH7247697.1 hypothetical protein BKA55DRAFT_72040 [Fusarium redolens]